MFTLDKDFLEGLGVDDMPEAEMKAFLEHLQEEMEVRVGERMSAGMSDEQVDEFERIIDGDKVAVQNVLKTAGEYENDEDYKKLVSASGLAEGSPELLDEYASMVWLRKNCPQYTDIVRNVILELKDEIKVGKDLI